MRKDDPAEMLRAAAEAVRPLLERSEPARRAARLFARWLLEVCAEPGEEGAGAAAAERAPERGVENQGAGERAATVAAAQAAVTIEPKPAVRKEVAGPRAIVPLRIGDATAHVPVAGSTADIGRARRAGGALEQEAEAAAAPARAIDLALVERRCALKAGSCGLYIERRAAAGDPEREPGLIERMNGMIAEAKALPQCFLWVFWREAAQPDDATLRLIAGCYDALREAVGLVRALDAMGEHARAEDVHEAMRLLAQADSGLRVALEATWMTKADADQDDVHLWMRQETAARSIFVPRHMRMDDPADPAQWAELLEAVRGARECVERAEEARRGTDARFKRIRWHARQIEGAPEGPQTHDIETIVNEIGALLEEGVGAGDARWARAIPAGVAALLPASDAAAAGVIARLVGAGAADAPEEAAPARRWSETVRVARARLEGRAVVIVGGEPRQDAIARLTDAFGFSRVDWVRLSEHGTGEPMRAPIQRADVAVVLVLIKLTGHLHAEQAVAYAKGAGKPCVLLPAGYSPEQVAAALVAREREPVRQEM